MPSEPATFGHCPMSLTVPVSELESIDVVIEHHDVEWEMLQARSPADILAIAACDILAIAACDILAIAGCDILAIAVCDILVIATYSILGDCEANS